MIQSGTDGAESGATARTLARTAGILFLLSMFGGGFGEFYAPTHILVAGDAAATARNVHDMDFLLRAGFAAYLVEAICDIGLAWLFYLLLKPVHRDLALLTAFFGIVSTATFAGFELFYFAPVFILGGASYLKAFTPEQLNALAMLSFKMYGYGAGLFMIFYGTGWLIRGYLMYHSGYFPKAIGALMALAGVGFIVKNLALVFIPTLSSDLLAFPMFVGGLALMAWLLVKGVDVPAWDRKTTVA